MKLRNKKTGEIKLAEARDDGIYLYNETTRQWYKYGLDLLAEWWEYHEEPKIIWYIDWKGRVQSAANEKYDWAKEKSIGNYFEVKEQAEKAVEKLKAWQRLKAKGFVWQDWEEGSMDNGTCVIGCQIPENNWETDVVEDLDLLFGGGDE